MKNIQVFFKRRTVQLLFLGIVIHTGVLFALFVHQAEQGMLPTLERPPAVEAFLPIGALVSLKHFLYTGTFNRIHPAGLALFLTIWATAVLAKKGFCSWVCPVGFLSEILARFHGRFFGKGLVLPAWVDIPLRSVKYLLAGFFIWTIFFKMPLFSLEQFIDSEYNRFSDIQMLWFFTRISLTALAVLMALLVLSLLVRNFWCRYLCPYGAVLGIIGFFSLGGIRRDSSHCTRCGRCEKVCQGQIRIMDDVKIQSPECTSCLECVNACPEKALGFSVVSGRFSLPATGLALAMVLLFVFGVGWAKLSGNWQNDISKMEYMAYTTGFRMPDQFRPDPEKMKRMIRAMQAMERSGQTRLRGSGTP